jgi:hypothetical protein
MGFILYLALIVVIIVVFLVRTKGSLLGESWHTIAQMQSNDLVPVLEKASLTLDDEVEQWMKQRGTANDEMILIKVKGGEEDSA